MVVCVCMCIKWALEHGDFRMAKIRVNSLNKLLKLLDPALRLGIPSASTIAEYIGCSIRHAYNYKYALEEIQKLLKSSKR